MANPEIVVEARRWLRYAREDLHVVERLADGNRSAPRHACWLAQQAAEKALKAALVLEGIDFPFTHDLSALRNLLPDGWPATTPSADLANLTVWGAESRYPGDWPEPTDTDSAHAQATARAVYDVIAREFRRRGIMS
ncbi:MAG: HEPN domain-containing protein [Chloroflexi bacterium]|nr:HEPN domain-containing protein [Chloroflexota bacterium]